MFRSTSASQSKQRTPHHVIPHIPPKRLASALSAPASNCPARITVQVPGKGMWRLRKTRPLTNCVIPVPPSCLDIHFTRSPASIYHHSIDKSGMYEANMQAVLRCSQCNKPFDKGEWHVKAPSP